MRGASATTTQKHCPSCRDRFSGEALFCPNDGSKLVETEADAVREPGGRDPAVSSPVPAPATPVDTYLGREISGHIEIRELAGVGAMGRVYRAFQRGIDRDVAVKILHRELSANPQLVARFHREAKVASRLQHPNVVHVHLAGQLPDGALYIVMEYLDGMSLQSALTAAGGPIPLPRALHIALQLCDAAGEAHAQGIVHRDLKPENVMLVRRGEDADYVKVLDFGIARLSWGEQSMATAAGLIFGTARYISPEGAQGESVGPPGDVYAIATLLYQMLVGRTPFEGEQAVGILIQQIHDMPPPLKSFPEAAAVPDALADIIMQNLAKDRNARIADARLLGRALLDVMRVSSPRVSGTSFPSVPSLDDLPLLPGAAATSRWTPPVALQAQLVFNPSDPRGSSPDVVSRPPPAVESRPEAMRGSTPTPTPAVHAPLAATIDDPDAGAALAARLAKGPTPLGQTVRLPPSFPVVESRRGVPPSGDPRGVVSPKPYSNVESTLSDAEPSESEVERHTVPQPRGRFARYVAMFFLLFLVGSAVAAGVAYHFGLLQPPANANNLEDLVMRARVALSDGRWDAPAGDNVQDLTNEGLVLWPGEPRLIEIRTRASDELMKRAINAKAGGDLEQAVRDARLATRFDPNDASKRALVHEYEHDIAQAESGPLLRLADGGTAASPRPGPAGPRATVETSPGKPRIGQQVDFAARISAEGKNVVDPRFVVTGAGLGGGAKLTALSEGGTYRAGFTFLEAGRYDVAFLARVDGTPVRAIRTVVVEGAKTAPAPPGEAPPPAGGSPTGAPPGSSASPAPSGSAKWL